MTRKIGIVVLTGILGLGVGCGDDGDTTPETTCYDIRGGASNQIAPGITCQFDFTKAAADFSFSNLGFRCCHP